MNGDDMFFDEACLLLMAAIRYLSSATRESAIRLLDISGESFDTHIPRLLSMNFVAREAGRYSLTVRGHEFFRSAGLASIDTREKKSFKEVWSNPMRDTVRSERLFQEIGRFKHLAEELHHYYSRKFESVNNLRFFMKKYLWYKTPDVEREFLEFPLTRFLFEIWINNIRGTRGGIWVDKEERVDFILYILERMKIAMEPAHSETAENFQNLAFSLKMLRQNNEAQMYLSFSFVMRPLKEFIRQYFNMAAITGNWDLLVKRFPPYHSIIKINPYPGERTAFDSRGIDFTPMIVRLDMRYSTGLGIDRVKTRSNERFVTCKVCSDPELEKEKAAQIENMEREIKGIFPSPDYMSNIKFGDDGKVWYLGNEEKEEIPNYGMRRSNYLRKSAELKIRKAIPCPSQNSGLVVSFSIMPPVRVLLEGLDGKRPLKMRDVIRVWKCLDIYGKSDIDLNSIGGDSDTVVDDVFDMDFPVGLSEDARSGLREIERLLTEDRTEEKAWEYLIRKFLEGWWKDLLQAICNRLTPECFDVFFSLFPLITGVEVTLTDSGEVEQVRKKNKFPLIDYLRRELEDLLKQIFSRHIDFSAATNVAASESRLAGMIVEHCVNVKSDPAEFANKLKSHLTAHYTTHYRFLQDYENNPGKLLLGYDSPVPAVLKQIDEDANGIISLIEKTRERLYSQEKNNRLLCFIDPESIVVQTNAFIFEGPTLDLERKYIQKKKIDESERKANLLEIEKLRREKEKEMARANKKLNLAAMDKIESGEIKEYANLIIQNAALTGGMGEVERIWKECPEIIWATDPEKYMKKKIFNLRKDVVKIFENASVPLTPEQIKMLLREDYKKPIEPATYQDLTDKLSEALRNQKTDLHDVRWK